MAAGVSDGGDGRALAIVGFMGAGKSTAAAGAARALGAEAIDVDAVIEQRLGRPIERIFAEDGEPAFRAAEEEITLELLDRGPAAPRVLALGGGAIGSQAIRRALRSRLVMWIDVDEATAWDRCRGTARPLASDRDEFRRLYARREPLYSEAAGIVVPHQRTHAIGAVLAAHAGLPAEARLLWATSASGDYPAYIGAGLLGPPPDENESHSHFGSRAAARPGPAQGRAQTDAFWPETVGGRRFLVTDHNAGRLYADRLPSLDGRVTIMPGEQSKTIAHAEIVWTELVRAGMTRADVVVALGGGVVGDLGGFCAATYQRGVRVVHVPTTLVAQVDSAYGGKTGVDLPEAKNYIGAYHQPEAVIVDTDALGTLPEEELSAGYAEVVKTALVAGGRLWELVRGGAGTERTDWPALVAACAHAKLRIVSRDERDEGPRQTLNLGHTVGHAIEAVTGYARYRHGEAVALGLLAALRLSGDAGLRDEVAALLRARGLPTALSGVDPDAVVMATARDKKRLGASPVPFVLLDAPGRAVPGREVAPRDLIAAVRELAS